MLSSKSEKYLSFLNREFLLLHSWLLLGYPGGTLHLAIDEILHDFLLAVLKSLGQRFPGLVFGGQLFGPVQCNVKVGAPAYNCMTRYS
jgi:hypothetical protein